VRSKFFLRSLIVLVCLAAVAHFSSQPFTEQDLRPEIERHGRLLQVIRKLPPIRLSYDGQVVDSRMNPADFIQFCLRKGAHILLYGVLGLALSGALGVAGLKVVRRWLVAGMLVALVAFLDEWHQLTVPGRTGRAADVLLDLAGFLFLASVADLCSLVVGTKCTKRKDA